ncbi:hypothetical protein CISG_05579 [Coccidioides immitis RMSCC 3703]|uniref:Uncharacterized protein n=2 Tax=Coccidioides immitis TaxID=5501 RepID=A0A0J8QUR1_COCIT|nr:hypothetical protein CIRG_02803 [Coccidioides immitis RMSCC 2394]KMU76211.1 hypothetical protein CISG_05579 [Coccidioides immitis RMSCC 3703]
MKWGWRESAVAKTPVEDCEPGLSRDGRRETATNPVKDLGCHVAEVLSQRNRHSPATIARTGKMRWSQPAAESAQLTPLKHVLDFKWYVCIDFIWLAARPAPGDLRLNWAWQE